MPTTDTAIGWTDDEDVQERFWANFDDSGSGCWEWTGGSNEPGYGRIRIQDKLRYAHRVAYQLECGPLDDGEQVNHHCDNPACVRPGHLFAGDQKQNVEDAIEYGDLLESRVRGPENGKSKLAEDQVREIRRDYAEEVHSQRELASKFGVSRGAIQSIVDRETWQHVDGGDV
jgi:hypothetical protein